MPGSLHLPVMPRQVIDLLQPKPGGLYVDATVGLGGHALSILQRSAPSGVLVGIDRDAQALELARERLAPYADRLHLIHAPFSRLPEVLAQLGLDRVDGLLADLGVSSLQLDGAARGFSFQQAGPLDMRMNASEGQTLSDLLGQVDADELAEQLRTLGEVKNARRLAIRILEAIGEGRVQTTLELAKVIAPGGRGPHRIHPATQVFMAMRMWLNRELDELNALLQRLPEPLRNGGRAVFISFHSLEDRLVKQRLTELEGNCTCPPGFPECRCGSRRLIRRIQRRVVRPEPDELAANPRARSARLRAAERMSA